MKSSISKTLTVAVLAIVGVAANACSSTLDKPSPSQGAAPGERTGSIGLRLQPVSGITVSNVHYVVTAGNPASTPAPATVAEGNLPTPGTSDNFSFGIPLPVGTGYFISLSGQSAETGDDITCTGSYGPFAVTPNTSTPFDMTLLCVDNTNGQVLSTVAVDTAACPRLSFDYAVAEPGSAQVGGNLAVHSAAHELDNPAEVITYAWSIVDPIFAGAGQFTPANAHDSVMHCAQNALNVKIKVTASNHECSKSLELAVSCVEFTCGNGVLDAGETCDTALDPTCPSDCTRLCGDGNAELGEACDPLPLNPAVCIPPGEPSACTLRPVVCGDGFVNGTEQCDPLDVSSLPPLAFCGSDCLIHFADCGNGIVEFGEECDPNDPTIPNEARNCGPDCRIHFPEACVSCEQAGDCFASSDNCVGTFANFTAAQTALCWSVAECIQDTNCLDGTGSLGKCYCGTLSTAACGAAPFDLTQPGAPNGPCAAIIQQGNADVTTNSAILGGLTNKARPAGAAGQRLNCEKLECPSECGLN